MNKRLLVLILMSLLLVGVVGLLPVSAQEATADQGDGEEDDGGDPERSLHSADSLPPPGPALTLRRRRADHRGMENPENIAWAR